jgi:hypothetical protein
MTVEVTAEHNVVVSSEGLFLAGSVFGVPGTTALRDDGVGADKSASDGVYTVVVDIPANSHHYYTFSNGAAPDWSGKEDITGGPCAYGTYSDRYLANSGTADFTVRHCFGHCAQCEPKLTASTTAVVTFQVDMAGQSVSADGVFVAGGQFGPPGSNPAYKMTKVAGDIYSLTINLPGDRVYNFKYGNGICDDYTCAELLDGSVHTCAKDEWNDRFMSVGSTSSKYGPTAFGGCGTKADTPPSGTSSVTFRLKMDTADVSAEGLFVAGGSGGEFGNPGDNQLVLNTRTGFYEVTVDGLARGAVLTYVPPFCRCRSYYTKDEPSFGWGCVGRALALNDIHCGFVWDALL